MSDDITDLDAIALSRAIHARRVSCREVMQAYLRRIGRLNPQARAIVNQVPDDAALAEAERCDAELARGRGRGLRRGSRGWLHGIPQAVKDTGHAAGLPTTQGSPLLKDAIAAEDSLYVARTRAAGAIVIGKTNMPELGLGSHTYNALFGATPNPWDPARSVGGSSGGAAAALALRLLPVADGSDFMGSLRNPAGWTHTFGLRPSRGRVPGWPKPDVWVAQLGTDGPMARTVADLAALLTTQAVLAGAGCASAGWPTSAATWRWSRASCRPARRRWRAAPTPARTWSRPHSASTRRGCGRRGWCGGARWWRPRWQRCWRCPARAGASSPRRCGSTTRRAA
jgi:amidase